MRIDTRSLTLFKIISLVLVVLCFIMMFLPWITTKVDFFGMKETESQNLFTVSGSDCFWTVMLSIFEILFFAAIALAVLGILTDRSMLAFPVAVLAVLMFLFDMFTCFWAKGQLKDTLGDYSSMFSDYGAYSIHVGIGAWLFLLFGLGAYFVLFYEDYARGRRSIDFSQFRFSGASIPKVDLSGLSAIGGWTCPACGAKQGMGQSFCSNCGARKPEAPRCPGCGKAVKPGSAFCSNCGTKI